MRNDINMNYSSTLNTKHQSGYTLLELLIAGVIGLILLLGVTQIYLNASRTNNFQSSVIEVQDKGRFVLALLEKDLQRAGWSNIDPGVDLGTLDAHIDFTATANGTGFNGSDSITVRYESDTEDGVDAEYSCDGVLVTDGDLVINAYSITDADGDGIGALVCNGRELIEGVESLQLLYGVESITGTQDGIVDGYVNAGGIGGYEELVATVRVGLLLRSTSEPLEQNNTNSYQVLDTTFAAQDDRVLRRAFTKTILLPNKPQAF